MTAPNGKNGRGVISPDLSFFAVRGEGAEYGREQRAVF